MINSCLHLTISNYNTYTYANLLMQNNMDLHYVFLLPSTVTRDLPRIALRRQSRRWCGCAWWRGRHILIITILQGFTLSLLKNTLWVYIELARIYRLELEGNHQCYFLVVSSCWMAALNAASMPSWGTSPDAGEHWQDCDMAMLTMVALKYQQVCLALVLVDLCDLVMWYHEPVCTPRPADARIISIDSFNSLIFMDLDEELRRHRRKLWTNKHLIGGACLTAQSSKGSCRQSNPNLKNWSRTKYLIIKTWWVMPFVHFFSTHGQHVCVYGLVGNIMEWKLNTY